MEVKRKEEEEGMASGDADSIWDGRGGKREKSRAPENLLAAKRIRPLGLSSFSLGLPRPLELAEQRSPSRTQDYADVQNLEEQECVCEETQRRPGCFGYQNLQQ